MPEELSFMMGKFEARFPTDRLYSGNHLWFLPKSGESTDNSAVPAARYRVGFTAYSVRLLRDVYFLDWSLEPGTHVAAKQQVGEIESSKAVSSLYVPVAGAITALNEALLDDPSIINVDHYGSGWLFEFATSESLLTPQQYLKVMEDGWDETQRMIKGQMNQ